MPIQKKIYISVVIQHMKLEAELQLKETKACSQSITTYNPMDWVMWILVLITQMNQIYKMPQNITVSLK